jgi:hypothetical protein
VVKHGDPKAALERAFGLLDRFEALEGAAVRAADEVPAAPPPAAEPELSQVSEPLLDVVAHAELEASLPLAPGAFAPSGSDEDPDPWPGPDPDTMRRQAALPRLVVNNPPPEPPERPEELSDAELIQLLPPKRPTDVAVGWECRAHDVLRAWRVEWFRAQKLVREQSAAHDWRAHCPVRLASIRDSP